MRAEGVLIALMLGSIGLATAASRALPIHFGEMVEVGQAESRTQPSWEHKRHHSLADATTTSASGWVYYNFYATTSCQGAVTYVTGLPMNTCLPPAVIAGKDTTTVTFHSFMLVNGTGMFMLSMIEQS